MMTVESEDITEPIKKVSSYISSDDRCIYGIKLCSEDGRVLFNQNWYEDKQPNYMRKWKHFNVPEGKQIIGVYGDMDKHSVTGLGLVIWIPGQNTK